MDKKIRIKFDNGDVFEIPAIFVANHRAKYYAEDAVKSGDNYQEAFDNEVEYAMNELSELTGWLAGNMDWDDIEDIAKRIKMRNIEYSYTEKWHSAEKTVR